jgi:hypothetical protein
MRSARWQVGRVLLHEPLPGHARRRQAGAARWAVHHAAGYPRQARAACAQRRQHALVLIMRRRCCTHAGAAAVPHDGYTQFGHTEARSICAGARPRHQATDPMSLRPWLAGAPQCHPTHQAALPRCVGPRPSCWPAGMVQGRGSCGQCSAATPSAQQRHVPSVTPKALTIPAKQHEALCTSSVLPCWCQNPRSPAGCPMQLRGMPHAATGCRPSALLGWQARAHLGGRTERRRLPAIERGLAACASSRACAVAYRLVLIEVCRCCRRCRAAGLCG